MIILENKREWRTRYTPNRSPNEMPVASPGTGTMPCACVGVLQYLCRSGRGTRFGDVIMNGKAESGLAMGDVR